MSAEVPGLFPVAIAGRPYLVEENHEGSDRFRRRSVEFIRQQADQSTTPGEATLTPDDLWRRAQEDWSHGAGQVFFDRPDSDRARFRSSKGIDPWTKWRISLLPDTDQKRSSANTNLALVPAGSRLYLIDGTELRYTSDVTVGGPTWTNVTGVPATAPVGLASDGFNVYSGHGAGGIYRTDTGSGTTASFNTRAANGIVAYVKGRLIVSNDDVVVNVTGATTETTILDHPNSAFRWVGAAEGPANIYLAGYAGDKSIVYRTAVKADGTALDVAVVAGELPDGEIVRSIQGYLGFLCIGTDRGVRFAAIDDNGNLTIGALIEIGSAVRCFEPQERFVWFGWTNYDSASTGLGRLDLTVFTEALTPAWASDLMATAQGDVLSVVTFQSVRVFAVSGSGVWAEDTAKVVTGSSDSGLITFGIPDPKVAMFLDVRHAGLNGEHSASVSVDGGDFLVAGSHGTEGSSSVGVEFPVGEKRGETFEVRTSLTRDSATTTEGPEITRSTLRAWPAPKRSESFFVVLVLSETIEVGGRERHVDIAAEIAYLLLLEEDGTPTTYQLGEDTHSVFIRNHEWIPTHRTQDGRQWNGLMALEMRSVG